MTEKELKQRTKKFAHDCVKLVLALPKDTLSSHVGRQLIRCATSVAANYRAACLTQSKPGFIAKLSIVVEEADESNFWLEFIQDEKIIVNEVSSSLLKESAELTAIFVASRKTAQANNEKQSMEN